MAPAAWSSANGLWIRVDPNRHAVPSLLAPHVVCVPQCCEGAQSRMSLAANCLQDVWLRLQRDCNAVPMSATCAALSLPVAAYSAVMRSHDVACGLLWQ
jgi:hypothetical protein